MKRNRSVDTLRFGLILLVFTTHLFALYSRAYLTPWKDGGLLDGLTGNFAVCFFALLLGYFAGASPERPLAERLTRRYLQFALGMLPPLLVSFLVSYALTRGAGVAESNLAAYSASYSLASGALQCLNDALFLRDTLVPTYWCMGTFFRGSAVILVLSALLAERPLAARAGWTLAAMALCVLTGSWLLCICLGGHLLRLWEGKLARLFARWWVRLAAVAIAVLIVRAPGYTLRCYMQGLASALLLLALLGSPRARRILACKPLARAGEVSFYFYLWHAPVQVVFFALCWPPLYYLAFEPGRWWITLLAWVVTLTISLALSFAQGWAHRRLMARLLPVRPASAAPEA